MIEEEFIVCRSCGKQVPQSQFCINCGYNLLKDKGRIQPDFKKVEENEQYNFPELSYSLETTENSSSAPLSEKVRSPFLSSPLVEEIDRTNIANAIDDLLKYQVLRIKLAKMLLEQEMSTRVFTNIWDNYGEVVVNIRKKIEDGPNRDLVRYNNLKNKLVDAESKFEELKVREAIGELTESDVLIRTPRIRDNIETLRHEISQCESLIKDIEMKPSDLTQREMFEHEQFAINFLLKIEKLVTEGKISRTHMTKVRTEMEEVKNYFSFTEGESSNQDLKNELETLEVRYKVGEITQAEMETIKKEIFSEFERKKRITQVT